MIGADAIHSRTRQITDPDAPKARYLGIVGRRRTAWPDWSYGYSGVEEPADSHQR